MIINHKKNPSVVRISYPFGCLVGAFAHVFRCLDIRIFLGGDNVESWVENQQLSNEKEGPWLFKGFVGDENIPSYVGIIRNHYKDAGSLLY